MIPLWPVPWTSSEQYQLKHPLPPQPYIRSFKVLRIIPIHKLRLNTQPGQRDLELVIRAAVPIPMSSYPQKISFQTYRFDVETILSPACASVIIAINCAA